MRLQNDKTGIPCPLIATLTPTMTQADKERANTQHDKPTNNLPNHLKRILIFQNHLYNLLFKCRIAHNHSLDSVLNRLLGA